MITKKPEFNPKIIISREAEDLVAKLLAKKPSERLGSGKHGYEDIKNHAWFKDSKNRKINFEKMFRKKVDSLFPT